MPPGPGVAHERARGRVVAAPRARPPAHRVARRRGGRAARRPDPAAAGDRAARPVDRPRPARRGEPGALGATTRRRPRHRRARVAASARERRAGRRGLGRLDLPGGGCGRRRARAASPATPGSSCAPATSPTSVLPDADGARRALVDRSQLGARQEAELAPGDGASPCRARARPRRSGARGTAWPTAWGQRPMPYLEAKARWWQALAILGAAPRGRSRDGPPGRPRAAGGRPIASRASCRRCRSCARSSTWLRGLAWRCPSWWTRA